MHISLPSLVFAIAVLIPVSVQLSTILKCYQGRYGGGGPDIANTVVLDYCRPFHKCCMMAISLNGKTYSCSTTCVTPRNNTCGPDPDDVAQIIDVQYCFCKSHEEALCSPRSK
ncbi:unnamed protein product [Enterobius vermicularis]|uniref:DB domain-containing protein n=1 Tax=Enterobius vermicularis TaxID=51028 RepID=A0A0N4UZ36_ENTVE|nr:unnamed protein product [Enterobius vermicularis]